MSFGPGELAERLWHPNGTKTLEIAAGERVVVYFELEFDKQRVVKGLRHRLTYRVASADGLRRREVLGAATPIDATVLPVLGPPLRGGPWVAVYDPALTRGHRRVYYVEGGVARLPGRFAIDWMRPIGGAASDDGGGQEVLAVADGKVISVRDGVPEPAKGAIPERIASIDAAGNFVALDIGAGRTAFYEHLQPGLAVAAGARVRRGQVIGRVGATGQAVGPHLHFHLADGGSPLGAEGRPYRLTGAMIIGRYRSIEAFGAGGRWDVPEPGDASAGASFPAPNVVVRFDSALANQTPLATN